MKASEIRWLDVVRHRVRSLRVPFLLIIQHHLVPSTTRLAAPLSPSLQGDFDILAPRVTVSSGEYRVRLLDISAVPCALIVETVGSLVSDQDAIMGSVDVILRGYPVGLPH